MTKTKKAFTLIELMVVVAIIAILATLAVSNFSTATRRARNSTRVSDIKAVATALETCANVSDGTYHNFVSAGGDISGEQTSVKTSTGATANGVYSKAKNPCLNGDVTPGTTGYNYGGRVISGTGSGHDAWVLCAKLEKVANWEGVGNSTSIPAASAYKDASGTWDALTGCQPDSAECYFCVFNQQ